VFRSRGIEFIPVPLEKRWRLGVVAIEKKFFCFFYFFFGPGRPARHSRIYRVERLVPKGRGRYSRAVVREDRVGAAAGTRSSRHSAGKFRTLAHLRQPLKVAEPRDAIATVHTP
jgi:hypothetical protein